MKTNTKNQHYNIRVNPRLNPRKSVLNEKGSKFNIALIIVAIFFFLLACVSILMFPAFFGGVSTGEETPGIGTGGGNLADANAMTPTQIDAFLTNKGSPVAGTGQALIDACKKFNVNPALLLGIFGAESTFGKFGAGVRNKNPGNVKASVETCEKYGIIAIGRDSQGHTIFPDWENGWAAHAMVLRVFYLDRGRDTIEKIAEIYLTGNKQRWINTVTKYMNEALDTDPLLPA